MSTQEENTPTIPQNYLQMPYNLHLWLRKEFMSLCGDAQEAMIMRVVEYEIEGDRRVWLRKATELAGQGKDIPEEPEWWITLSHKQIIARLYESIKDEKTLRKKLKSLIEEKQFLLVRDNPDNHYGAPQYTINRALVQDGLNNLPPLPGISDAAKAQVDPLPKLGPPTKVGTPYQSSQGGDTKNGTSPLPKVAPPSYQNREVPPTKSGTPYKKEKNSKNLSKNTEERRNDVTSTSSLPDTSFIHSSPDDFIAVDNNDTLIVDKPTQTTIRQGDTNLQPAGVKGVSQSSNPVDTRSSSYPLETTMGRVSSPHAPTNVAQNDTLNLANDTNHNSSPIAILNTMVSPSAQVEPRDNDTLTVEQGGEMQNAQKGNAVQKSEGEVSYGYMIGSSIPNINDDVDKGSTCTIKDASSTIDVVQPTLAEVPANTPAIAPNLNDKAEIARKPGIETGKPRNVRKPAQQSTLIELELVEPEMIGAWNTEKVVQYAEFHNGKRYPEKQRSVQLEAARVLHKDDAALTLEQFKLAYDECLRDGWWKKDGPGDLHVKHMQRKESNSGMVRLYAMLNKVEARNKRKIIPIRPKDDHEAIERAKINNQQALEKVRRLIAEKQEREKNHAIAK